MLLYGHLKVQANELTQMPMCVGVLSPGGQRDRESTHQHTGTCLLEMHVQHELIGAVQNQQQLCMSRHCGRPHADRTLAAVHGNNRTVQGLKVQHSQQVCVHAHAVPCM